MPLALQSAKLRLVAPSTGPSVAEMAFRRGRAGLLESNLDLAIAELEAATAHAPDDPAAWNDLAAAYLTRHVVDERSWDLVSALGSAREALRLAPEAREARFNYALCLSGFSLRRQAKIAWERFFDLEADSAWLTEARTFYGDAIRRRPADEFEAQILRLEALEAEGHAALRDGAVPAAEELVGTFPFLTRRWLEEELLGRWARSASSGDPSADSRLLDLAERIATTLERARGEKLPADAVAVLRAATDDVERRSRLIEAHVAFASALASYRKQEFLGVEEALKRAEAAFRRAGSPMADWARFYRWVCIYYREPELAEREFLELAADVSTRSYPTLQAHAKMMAGMSLGVRTTGSDREIALYEDALETLTPIANPSSVAFLRTYLAEALDSLGEVEESFDLRLAAGRDLAASGFYQHEHNHWLGVSQALIRRGRQGLAEPVLRELLATAEEWEGHPLAAAEARVQLGWNLQEIGKIREARGHFRSARETLTSMETAGQARQRLLALADLYEGMGFIDSEPRLALQRFERSFAVLDRLDFFFERPRFLAEKARAHRLLGEEERARQDLEAALELWSVTKSGLGTARRSFSSSSVAEPLVDELTDLYVDKGELHAAFEVAEFGRTLAYSSGSESLGLERSQQLPPHLLPAGMVLVEYLVSRNLLAARVSTATTSRVVVLGEAETDLPERVSRLRKDLDRRAGDAVVRSQLEDLHGVLVEPLELPDDSQLVIVPDRWLGGVPFAALRDAHGGWLVDRHPVLLVPARKLLGKLPSSASASAGRVLVVAPDYRAGDYGAGDYRAGDYRAGAGPRLPTLRSAEGEAFDVAQRYEEPRLLRAHDATRAAVLAALPEVSILHFAGHAVAGESAARSRLWLARQEGEGYEPLAVEDLWRSDLSHLELVVLSACETAAASPARREALFGLAGGFLHAGVGRVVASLWRTADAPSREFMSRFHEEFARSRDAARSAQVAMRGLRDRGFAISEWSSYAVLGTGPS